MFILVIVCWFVCCETLDRLSVCFDIQASVFSFVTPNFFSLLTLGRPFLTVDTRRLSLLTHSVVVCSSISFDTRSSVSFDTALSVRLSSALALSLWVKPSGRFLPEILSRDVGGAGPAPRPWGSCSFYFLESSCFSVFIVVLRLCLFIYSVSFGFLIMFTTCDLHYYFYLLLPF